MGIYKTIADVYNHLQDCESRSIFKIRSLCSMTGYVTYFGKYVSTVKKEGCSCQRVLELLFHELLFWPWKGGFR